MNKSMRNIALVTMLIMLLVWSAYAYYNAYRIWYRYQDVLSWSILYIAYPHVYRKHILPAIEAYEKLFLPYLISGSASLLTAVFISVVVMNRKFKAKQLERTSLPTRS